MEKITIATPFVGKAYCITDYLKGLESLDYPKDKINLIFYDASNDKVFKEILDEFIQTHKKEYASTRYETDGREPMHDVTAGNAIKSARVASVYNRIKYMIETDLVLIIEDDIVAPPNTIKKLLENLTDGVGMIIARQMCRWSSDIHEKMYPLAWSLNKVKVFGENDSCSETGYDVQPLKVKEKGIETIDATPMGCNLIRTKLFKQEEFRATDNGLMGFDLIFANDLNMLGYKVLIDWSIHCKHFHQDNFKIRIFQ